MAKKEEWVITMTKNQITAGSMNTDYLPERKRLRRKKKIRKFSYTLLTYIALILIALVCAGPFFWIFITSFKSSQNIYDMSIFIKNPTLDNYIGVFNYMSLPRYILNTVIITVGGIVLDVLLAALCAYPLACMDFYGKKFIFGALISTMILPNAAGLVVNYLTIKNLGLLDKYFGVILPSAVTVFSIILMRQAYLNIPNDLVDAAKIDGASELKTWYKIMVPQIKPAVSTIVIFDFIGRWNTFLWPIIVLQNPQKYPLAAALKYLGGQFNYKFGYIAAGTVISIIPVIIIFLAFQKYFVNTVAGAIKA